MDYGRDIDTTSLLLARGVGGVGGYGGYGGYGMGGGYLNAEAHANGTATKEAIDNGKSLFVAGLDRVSAQNKETRDNFRFDQLQNAITNQEFRSIDRQRDIEKVIADNAKDAALCCCDAKLEACKAHAEIMALVLSENAATRTLITGTALDAANAKIIQLETINALSGHHRP